MPLSVRDVCRKLEEWAPAGLAYSWDRSGLSVGTPGQPVLGVLACLTVTREALARAREAGADLIVSHHPLIWDPLERLDPQDPHTRLCLDAAHGGLAVFSLHTNLDVAPGGVNHVLAQTLGLREMRPLFEAPHAGHVKLVTFVPEPHLAAVREAVSAAGAGIIGAYTHCSFSTPGTGTFLPGAGADPYSGERGVVNEEAEVRFETLVAKARLAGVLAALQAAHPYEEVAYDVVSLENVDPAVGLGARGVLDEPMTLGAFAGHVRNALGLEQLRFAGAPGNPVRSVAVLGGAGGSEAGKVPADIDVFVTGDVKYHDALSALERGLAVVDAGHAGTERGIVEVIASYLRAAFPGLPVAVYREPEVFHTVTA